jgi:TldD protein
MIRLLMKRRTCRLAVTLVGGLLLLASPSASAADPHPLLAVMQDELDLSMAKLEGPEGSKPYFLAYSVTDQQELTLSASLGALETDTLEHTRLLDVDARVGDYTLDNTHQIRETGGFYSFEDYFPQAVTLPLDGDEKATRFAIWLKTDQAFKAALKRFGHVQTNVKVKVEEEDQSDDFSREEPSEHIGPWHELHGNRQALADRARILSQRFREHPLVYNSGVTINAQATNRLQVTSEGTRLQFGREWYHVRLYASTVAEDGMQLWQYDSFSAATPEGLPADEEIAQAIDRIIDQVLALREAPIVEPYVGPAILVNRASGVFFHEIFGHRIEGHRQKDVEEGQTFAKKIGEPVLPDFISVIDDPTRATFNGEDLDGHYEFDDEGMPAQPVTLVKDGILKTFLMSRSPVRGFTKSNGHGRREPGAQAVSRQGNLIIESKKQVPFDELRQMLIEECKKQDKEFGLMFSNISGGFTMTQRWLPQSFKVLPLLVYRVYADGRPDELVRGVDIVGTPLTCFSKILCTGNDPDIFNGMCGAESGAVPVSAVSPSILVGQIEVEKRQKAQDRPPILEPPIALPEG